LKLAFVNQIFNYNRLFIKSINNSKFHFIFYTFCFVIYGVYLGMNWREIAHFNDTPVYLFYIDFEKFFFTPHNRYISIFTQYLPLIATLLGLSFTAFVKCYVYNGLFSTFILYLIFGFYSKKWHLGWVFLLCLSIGYQYSFFYGVPEHFGYSISIFFTLLYYHILCHCKGTKWLAFSSLIGLMMAGAHLFSVIILLTGFLYIFILEPSTKLKKILVIHVSIFLLTFISIKLMVPPSDYEVGKIQIVIDNLKYIKTLDNAAFRYIFSRDQKNAIDFYSLIIAISGVIIWKKEYLVGVITIILFYLFYYLNCLYSYQSLGTEYMELYGRLIFFALLIPLMLIAVKYKLNHPIFILLCLFSFGAFLNKTSSVKHLYTKRYTSIFELSKFSKSDKVYIQSDSICSPRIWFTWALPHESMLVNMLEGHPKTVYIFNGNNLSYEEAKQNYFNGSLREFNRDELRGTYFNSLDTFEYQFQKN